MTTNPTQHTPAPWNVSLCQSGQHQIYAESLPAENLAIVYSRHNHRENAALISASPELLDALKQLAFSLSDNPEDYPDMESYNQINTALQVAYEAIRKAEGK